MPVDALHSRPQRRFKAGQASDGLDPPRPARLQIHDELLFEVRADAVAAVAAVVRDGMERAWAWAWEGATQTPLRVPLRVSLAAGPSWGDLEPLP